ncbi:Uncharacterized protein DBV15_06793 [Temnothorax longispinosus]|uniref:Uncharacterized protein n=1 Tax=Temnothorax longispinosus TaxID=300112 RepID=A0A4V3SC03_9HYME|nr:Uncharacterized protein DBV15_06793 [Temnothorax longispinosus]
MHFRQSEGSSTKVIAWCRIRIPVRHDDASRMQMQQTLHDEDDDDDHKDEDEDNDDDEAVDDNEDHVDASSAATAPDIENSPHKVSITSPKNVTSVAENISLLGCIMWRTT